MVRVSSLVRKSKQAGTIVLALLVMSSGLPVAAAVPSKAALADRVQSVLLQMAAQCPGASLDIIVQKSGRNGNAERAVTSMGGTVTNDLHLINAFSASVPADALERIAQDPGVRYVSFDSPVEQTSSAVNVCSACIDTSNLLNSYDRTVGADRVWNEGPGYIQGQGIGVAVVDSGVTPQQDLTNRKGQSRIVASVMVNPINTQTVNDTYGHGSHIAGIIGGSGQRLNGQRIGIAPNTNIINVKVSDDSGTSTASSLVLGLQWVYDHRLQYNIRVVNLSMNSNLPSLIDVDPIDAAVEILWFNSVVVVASAGNTGGTTGLTSPGNDPFVITVGATDDRGTPSLSDDVMAPFSAYGTTPDGTHKPDLVAPGTKIVSLLAGPTSILAVAHPGNVVNSTYFRMSGTSMSAPMVAGAAALILQQNPNLTPDQVKYRLISTARPFDTTYRAGAGYLDVYAAVHSTSTASANTGQRVSNLLTTGLHPINWGTLLWNSANWNTTQWDSVNWNSVNWNSVNWNSDWWGS